MKKEQWLKWVLVGVLLSGVISCTQKNSGSSIDLQSELDQAVHDKACQAQFPGMNCKDVMEAYSAKCDPLKSNSTAYSQCLVQSYKEAHR